MPLAEISCPSTEIEDVIETETTIRKDKQDATAAFIGNSLR
jgi:hypothetical protein